MRTQVSAVLVMMLAACSADTASRAAATATTASPTQRTSAQSAQPRLGQVSYQDAALTSDDDFVQFMLPSNNIGCALGQAYVTCEINQADWPGEQTRPADCEGDWDPHGISLNNGTTYLGGCASDSVMGGKVLPYGHGLQSRDVSCASSIQGLQCQLRASGHGFKVSREAFHRF